ncbi:MAG: bifunctional ADP-dependent NAD(P)H-hydrate dehydratase/NAD(P)H-hydrate epimerase [Acidobacteria bacterium]|nr:MAG: bifunctional ADP-dependent NAD(P)H-hydrate dehydratase/NAD(P)H-hydrate epimerase [Acidobacteriota bacterium]
MLEVLTPQQMAECDRRAIAGGTPGIVLMERAGSAVAVHAQRMLGGAYGKRVTVLAGSGNNGGDGLVVARKLQRAGALVKVALLTPAGDLSGDPLAMYERLVPLRVAVGSPAASLLVDACGESDLIVDALFGTGFHGSLSGAAAEWVRAVGTSGRPVISIDVPSGVNGSSGEVSGPAIRADLTVAIEAVKTGLIAGAGPVYAGRIEIAPIGISTEGLEPSAVVFEYEDINRILPRRSVVAHKWSAGSVLIVAGSRGMSGAAIMAARSALISGAGIVTACVPKSIQPALAATSPEIMTLGLPETADGTIDEEALEQVVANSDRFGVVAIGPGLGRDPSTGKFVTGVLRGVEKPIVVDADGLNLLGTTAASVIGRRSAPTVITPHPGELARMLGATTSDVEAERLDLAATVAGKWGCVVVLKGSRTLIAAPDVPIAVNPTGGPELATAGSGDVLTGIVAGLVAQSVPPNQAGAAAAFVHGLAGSIAGSRSGGAGVTALAVAGAVPDAIDAIRQGGLTD